MLARWFQSPRNGKVLSEYPFALSNDTQACNEFQTQQPKVRTIPHEISGVMIGKITDKTDFIILNQLLFELVF